MNRTPDWNHVQRCFESKQPICLFDFPGREEETDVLFIGCEISPANVDFLRRDVGGPLAVYIAGQILERLGIRTFCDFIRRSASDPTLLQLVRPGRSHDPRFAISLDARENRTGCSPRESANTVNLLVKLVREAGGVSDSDLASRFVETFISPGHIPVIHVAKGLLAERNGHAELSLTLAQHFGLPPIVSAGELIDSGTLESMQMAGAQEFAASHGMPFITGSDVLALPHHDTLD